MYIFMYLNANIIFTTDIFGLINSVLV